METAGFQKFIYYNMVILFVPLNPAPTSWDNGHYFSTLRSSAKSNLWYQLYHAEFCSKLYSELEADVEIFGKPVNRLGIIDLVNDKVTSKPKELKKEDIERGRSRLKKEIYQYKPKIVCSLGKGTYRKFKGMRNKDSVEYGLQDESIGKSRSFVAAFPSSMDQNAEAKIKILKNLYALYSRYK